MKKSIIIYADCIAILEELTFEQAGRLFKAILAYVNEEPVTEIEDDPAIRMAFKVLKTQIDRDADKYEQICERRRENINKRWHKKQPDATDTKDSKSIQKNTSEYKSIQMGYDSENDSENDSDSESTIVDNTLDPNGSSSSGADDPIKFSGLVSFFNDTLRKFNSVIKPIRDIKGKRQDAVRARVRERGKKSLAVVFVNAAKSDFLNGKNDRCFIATFDWLIAPNNFIKVLEGNYDNIQNNGTNRQHNSAEQRRVDAASIAARLLDENE